MAEGTDAAWPSHWEATVVTADGGAVHVRPITPDDADRLVAFHGRQSPESIYFRYFSARPRLSPADVRRFTHVDLRDRVAFVALLGDELVGVGRYDRYKASHEAEVAFFIDDAHHGRGLATILLEYLAAAGRDNGITDFVATVLPSNRAMLSVFTQAGFEAAARYADGVVEVRFAITPTEASAAAQEERATSAEARTVARLLEPRSVAVIGAGRRPGSIGHEVLRQLLAGQFAGPVYAVNPEATHVASVPAWPSILDVPTQVDLAVVAVPAADVLDAVEECARARVGALVVVSTGFAEAGPEGIERGRDLVVAAHRHGIRVLGPGSFGVLNTDPEVRLHASFAPVAPLAGRVAMSLQSGTLAAGLLRQATAVGLGFSSVVAVGDKVDVSGNDLLAWWEHDDRTDVIVLSLASYGNPRRFRRLAPRVGRRKPIVAQVRSRDADVEALLAQSGVVGVEGLDDLIDVARMFAWQPVPAGRRVAIVADSHGSAEYASVALAQQQLEVAATVVLGPDAIPSAYERAVGATLGAVDDGEADAALVVYAAALAPRPHDVAAAVVAGAATAPAKPVLASFPGHDLGGALTGRGAEGVTLRIPELGFPDAAARALGAAVRYGRWRARPVGVVPALAGVDLAAVDATLADRPLGELGPVDAAAVLRATGIEVAEVREVTSAGAAAAATAELGGPVALKAVGRGRAAKIEASGVALDLHAPEAAAASYGRMAASLGEVMTGAVVQRMVPPGTDVRITVDPAPVVGAAIGLGVGGAIDPPPAVVHAVLPLTDVAAADLVARAGLAERLDPESVAALVDLLHRVAHLADERPGIARLELNPVIVADGVAHATDVVVERRPVPEAMPEHLRRLG